MNRTIIAVGEKYITAGSVVSPTNVATIFSVVPFVYHWQNDGSKGLWSLNEFGNQIRSGYLKKVVDTPTPATIKTSPDILKACLMVQQERGKQRDSDTGERSMKRTVEMFNACFGTALTETQGWQFMVCLKMARSVHGDFNMDDFIDGTSYFALAGESAAKGA